MESTGKLFSAAALRMAASLGPSYTQLVYPWVGREY